jgi:hypothetical protein
MFTENMVTRFGAKLREIEPLISQRLPVPMANLLKAIAQAEQRRKGESNSAKPGEDTSGNRP